MTTAMPSYARRVAPHGGGWRLRLLNFALRWSMKRRTPAHPDVARLRVKATALDRRFARVDLAVHREAVDGACVRAEWIETPGARSERVILYLHGGAFILRLAATHAAMLGPWCRGLNARALMVDYRLAPEHPFPAAPDDCHAAYRWLLAQGCDPRSIVVAGDSAGGNLALVTLLQIRDAGEPLPACAVLLSPVVDFTFCGPSLVENEQHDPLFTLGGLLRLRTLYAPPEQFLDPAVSPLFGDFRGLPPLLVQAGTTEMLRDEATRAAAKAYASGVPVELELWEGMPHVFQAMPMLPQAGAATESILRFIRGYTGWG